MDKQKQIEEMAKVIYESKVAIDGSDMAFGLFDEDDHFHRIAKFLYTAGYRKIDENAVVLSREEYTNYIVEYMGVKEIKERVRKETAEKFAERLKLRLFEYMDNDVSYDEFCKANVVCGEIDEICKEIKEAK